MIKRTAQGYIRLDEEGRQVAGPFRTFGQAAGAIAPEPTTPPEEPAPDALPPEPGDAPKDEAPKRKRAPRKRKTKTTPKEG